MPSSERACEPLVAGASCARAHCVRRDYVGMCGVPITPSGNLPQSSRGTGGRRPRPPGVPSPRACDLSLRRHRPGRRGGRDSWRDATSSFVSRKGSGLQRFHLKVKRILRLRSRKKDPMSWPRRVQHLGCVSGPPVPGHASRPPSPWPRLRARAILNEVFPMSASLCQRWPP